MLFQWCARDFTILHKPEPLPWIPPSSCCFGCPPFRQTGYRRPVYSPALDTTMFLQRDFVRFILILKGGVDAALSLGLSVKQSIVNSK